MSNTYKIVNKQTGLEIEGALTRNESPIWFGFKIEGADSVNSFYAKDWDIIELPKPLPTEPGYYVVEDFDMTNFGVLYHLNEGGWGWGRLLNGDWQWVKEAEVPRNLVRLVKEQA